MRHLGAPPIRRHDAVVDAVLLAALAMRRVLGIILRGGQGENLVPPTAVAGGDEGFVFEFEASNNNNSSRNPCSLCRVADRRIMHLP